jgi:hypothetical protein
MKKSCSKIDYPGKKKFSLEVSSLLGNRTTKRIVAFIEKVG